MSEFGVQDAVTSRSVLLFCVGTNNTAGGASDRDALLILTNKGELFWDVKVRAALASVNQRRFRILRGGSKDNSRNATLDFRKAGFGPPRDLLGSIPGEMDLERRGIWESWLIFKDCVLKAQ